MLSGQPKHSTSANKSAGHKIGLLLVHGIGEQVEGETTQKFIDGLKLAFPQAKVDSESKPVTVELGDRKVLLYEVYWADLLSGERVSGTAYIEYLLPLAWLPWLNRSSAAFRADYSTAHTIAWCAVLCSAGVGLWFAWQVLAIFVDLSILLKPIRYELRRLSYILRDYMWGYKARLKPIFPATPERITQFQQYKHLRSAFKNERPPEPKRTSTILPGATDTLVANSVSPIRNFSTRMLLRSIRSFRTGSDDFLDDYVGDIQNYLNSCGHVFPEDHPLATVSADIRSRFHKMLREVYESGCDEIQILAHSLGTVIAYHGLTGFGLPSIESSSNPAGIVTPLNRVTHLFTFGSPLEKIRFLWPKLILEIEGYQVCWTCTDKSDCYRAPVQQHAAFDALQWDNFWNSLDVIAGKLTHFDAWGRVHNHPVRGGASVLRSHVIYQRTSDFLAVVTKYLIGGGAELTRTAGFWNRILAGLENIGTIVVLFASIALGLVFIYGIALGFGYLTGILCSLAGASRIASTARNITTWFMFLATATSICRFSKRWAELVYARHWFLTC